MDVSCLLEASLFSLSSPTLPSKSAAFLPCLQYYRMLYKFRTNRFVYYLAMCMVICSFIIMVVLPKIILRQSSIPDGNLLTGLFAKLIEVVFSDFEHL